MLRTNKHFNTMIVLSFKSKKDKEKLYEKAKKMEEFAAEIVDCIEEAMETEEDDYDYSERMYKGYGSSHTRGGRYDYRGGRY